MVYDFHIFEKEKRMPDIRISKEHTYFEKNGKPFFLLCDTVWMAFQKLSLKEWRELVRFRKEQGFDALQISVLPIAHDNSVGEDSVEPFCMKDGKYDFDHINEVYFDRAEKMLRVMQEYDMIPFLHLFWVNYIPETWAAAKSPDTVIPFDRIEGLTRYFLKRFDQYQPIYSVSGDTGFETETVVKYYQKILDVMYENHAERLTTFHLQPEADPPSVLCEHPQYQFYSYQSGHGAGVDGSGNPGPDQNSMLVFSRQFLEKKAKKPVMNTEICYEGHGYGFSYGRFYPADVRKAVWRSILSGASAGVTYGAHGLWQFYESDALFNNAEFSRMPYAWQTALRFPGASDAAFAKWIFEKYALWELCEFRTLDNYGGQVQQGCAKDKTVIYLPYNDDVVLEGDFSDYRFEAIGLESRQVMHPLVRGKKDETVILKTSLNEDILILGVRDNF